MQENIILPLFPTSGVIIPYGSMLIKATDEPYLQLLKYCIKNKEMFASIYFDENGIREVGCACEISEYQCDKNEIVCQINATRRISINSIVQFSDHQNKPQDCIQFKYISGTFHIDTNTDVRDDISNSVIDKFKDDPDIYGTLINLSKQKLDEGLSFFILDNLVDDQTIPGNLIRYEFLTKRSENKRFRLLRKMMCETDSSNDLDNDS